MLKLMYIVGTALLVPMLLAAQTPKVARRATRVRGEAVGLDNRPVTPAQPTTSATTWVA